MRVGIIGGGIFGVATARNLVQSGVEVTLYNDGPLGEGASGRSIAWLNSAGFRSPEYHRLRMLGLDRWRSLRFHHPDMEAYVHFDGALRWKALDANPLRDSFEHEQSIGYDARWLSALQVAAIAPAVEPSAIDGGYAIYNPGEGWVDLPGVVELFAKEIEGLGGKILDAPGTSSPVVEGGKVKGVATASGKVREFDAVVLATGPSVPPMLASLGVPMGDESPIGLVVFTEPVDFELRVVLNTPRAAVRPTIDGGLAIDSDWSEREIVIRDDGSFEYSDETVRGLLFEASRLLKGCSGLEAARVGAGRKPIPAGGEPVVGAVADIEGLFVAFSHSGATLGLVLPELLAREVAGGPKSPLLSTFRPDRYAK